MADTTCFEDSRFGMFVHFGLYSNPAGCWKGVQQKRNHYAEWIRYQGNWPYGIPADEYNALAKEFNPVKFNADEWISEAKNAGMKYLVVTSKHHDGFALWDSKADDFNVVRATPFKRDIIAELRDSCEKHGVIMGAYYSHWQDWHHEGGALPHWPEEPDDPAYPMQDDAKFEKYWQTKCLPQVKELITEYRVKILWFDCWKFSPLLTPARLEQLIRMIRETAPDVLINSRIGTTWNHPKGDELVDYFSTGDNQFLQQGLSRPWETSGTFNRSWGYNRFDHNWLTTEQLLKNLISNASRNGNYQLNVGPKGDGSIPPPSIRRMRELGAWLAVNGEAVYATRPADRPEPSWGRLTRPKNSTGILYAHVFTSEWREALIVEKVGKKPGSIKVLETGQSVNFELADDKLIIKLPPEVERLGLFVLKIEF